MDEWETTVGLRQARWSASTKTSWTQVRNYSVTGHLQVARKNRPEVRLSYHMMVHCCFQQYLHRMGSATGVNYLPCNSQSDTTKHTLFECPSWGDHRGDLCAHLGHHFSLSDLPDNLGGPPLEGFPDDPAVIPRFWGIPRKPTDSSIKWFSRSCLWRSTEWEIFLCNFIFWLHPHDIIVVKLKCFVYGCMQP